MEKGGLHPTSRTTATSGAKTTLVTTPFPPSHPGLPQFVIQMRLLFYHGYYSFQFNRFFWGISPAGGGIYPSARGINLDLCLCTIPTVGFYGKIGKITATHHQNIKHIHGDAAAALRRLYRHEPPLSSPAVARRRLQDRPAVGIRRGFMLARREHSPPGDRRWCFFEWQARARPRRGIGAIPSGGGDGAIGGSVTRACLARYGRSPFPPRQHRDDDGVYAAATDGDDAVDARDRFLLGCRLAESGLLSVVGLSCSKQI